MSPFFDRPAHCRGISGLLKLSKPPALLSVPCHCQYRRILGAILPCIKLGRDVICVPPRLESSVLHRKTGVLCSSTLSSHQRWELFKSKLGRQPQACFAIVIILQLNCKHWVSGALLLPRRMVPYAIRHWGLGVWEEWFWSEISGKVPPRARSMNIVHSVDIWNFNSDARWWLGLSWEVAFL